MHGVLAALVAAEEIDPATIRPSALSSLPFLFLLAALILLLWSFVRHLRRVQSNLGSARAAAPAVPSGPSGPSGPSDTDTGGPGTVEGDSR